MFKFGGKSTKETNDSPKSNEKSNTEETPTDTVLTFYRQLYVDDIDNCIIMNEKIPKEIHKKYSYLSSYGLNKNTSLNDMYRMNTNRNALLPTLSQNVDSEKGV